MGFRAAALLVTTTALVMPVQTARSQMPETLDQAWAIALEVDQRLDATRWQAAAAESSLRASQGQRWPTATVEGSYTVQDSEQAFRFAPPLVPGLPAVPQTTLPFSQSEFFAFQANINVPLYTSGRIQSGIDAASANLSAAQFDVRSSRLDLKMQVAEQYVAVLRAEREVDVAASQVRSLQEHARTVEIFFQRDVVPKNDLLAAQVALADGQHQAIRASNQLDISRAAYNRRLGRPLNYEVQLAAVEVEEDEMFDLDALTARALGQRPEQARTASQAAALRHQAASLLASNRPQVELQGAYAFQENRFVTPEGIASAGVGVSWNLFDGRQGRNQADALLQQAQALERLRADMRSQIQLEVRHAWLDVQETRRRMQVTREAIERAEENLRVARQRYEIGAATNIEVLDAETLRTRAQRNDFHAVYDAVLATLRLRRATGEL